MHLFASQIFVAKYAAFLWAEKAMNAETQTFFSFRKLFNYRVTLNFKAVF